MRRYLAEFKAGEIARTETTELIAAEFARVLGGKRGRPPKPRTDSLTVGLMRERKLNKKGVPASDKHSVLEMIEHLANRRGRGATLSKALEETANEFGMTADGVRKRLARDGLMPFVEGIAGVKAKYFQSPWGQAMASIREELLDRAREMGLPVEQALNVPLYFEEDDDRPVSVELVREAAFAGLERLAQAHRKKGRPSKRR
ncbi:hypothetical protein [Archangium lansingense]|uniref:Uncharacterized protein n=1 Tax=Archangium lansingense TaxID=2995310 RepID=A0ABT4AB32_9BACT|nr:hypothetical protein [Archangium lansinium]MCY1078867.1 hypothetical protein [Archangium lansinium]